ncbi:MAG: 3-oxoacyl-[acyl-carrier-protein] reductase [Christensenellales bacterium]
MSQGKNSNQAVAKAGQKVALVSGASRGIGRSIAVCLAKAGYDIALVYSSSTDQANETKRLVQEAGANALCFSCDVSDYEKTGQLIKEVTENMGRIAVLVNNAGITRDKLMVQMSPEDFDRVLEVNLKGAFNLIRHCYQGFMRARSGRIINISSVVGISGNAGQTNYSAAKAGLIGLTKSVAKELAPRGVTCNAIAPGMIETDMTESMTEAQRQAFVAVIPLKRSGMPEEVANLAAFLASDAAAYITGAIIPVDGGLSM